MTAAAAVTVAVDIRLAGAEPTTLPDEWVPRPDEQSWWQTRQSREALVERLLHAFTDPSAGRTRDKTRRRRGPAPGNTTQCQTKASHLFRADQAAGYDLPRFCSHGESTVIVSGVRP